MCGILAVVGCKDPEVAKKLSQAQSHRGPDERGMVINQAGVILCHERLSIIDLHTGRQPLKGCHGAYLVHNGEIYNHKKLKQDHIHYGHSHMSQSDSEIILHLWEEKGPACVFDLDGVFSFVIADGDQVFAARDPIGVKPLFYGADKDGAMWFASEIKVLSDHCETIKEFPPGHYYTTKDGFKKYYDRPWMHATNPTGKGHRLRQALEDAVIKRLMSDVPIGVFLSGGLDSSLVASIVSKHFKKWGKTLKTFSIGINKNSPDLKAAREVAEFIGSEHHEVIYTFEEGLAQIPHSIKQLETYDVTTIRAGTPMKMLSRYISDLGIKVVLSGEGADEIFGGYLYFHGAPTDEDFHQECVRRVGRLHTADVLRADRSTMGEALEARVPFLDLAFLDEAMNTNASLKRAGSRWGKIEKHILRLAFDQEDDPYLPKSILWRQKEQFSDGVGYGWVDGLKDYAQKVITDEMMEKAFELYPHNTPTTKEAFFYREIYESFYTHPDAIKNVLKWIPKWQFDRDPSGRASFVHKEGLHKSVGEEVDEDVFQEAII